MTKSEKANECFISGFNCAQAVFSSFCEELGFEREPGLKISSSFGGGMAHLNETCGAVTGALMAIGLKYGRTNAEDTGTKEKNYDIVNQFANNFINKFGSLKCTELIGYNLSTDEGLEKAREENRFRTHCPLFVKEAASITEDLLK
ncbi:MAG: C_GCAxxG_C_C family protein [Ignavibacteriales bacterium]|nr:MAG: C_GCAxxG_C_C family protein [Ignavibacteriales bacterium]